MPLLQDRCLINPDYIVCDRVGNALPYDGNELKRAVEDLETRTDYEKLFDEENLLLFRRREKETLRWRVFSKDEGARILLLGCGNSS